MRPEPRSDCSRCAALCCIAYPAEEMPGFAASKEAGEACPHLSPDARCRIHGERAERGFAGCIAYECFGAGQHVTQVLFGGRDWRDDPALLAPMVESFLLVRKACDLLFLTDHARSLGGPARLDAIEAELTALVATAEVKGKARDLARLEEELRRMFSALRGQASTRR